MKAYKSSGRTGCFCGTFTTWSHTHPSRPAQESTTRHEKVHAPHAHASAAEDLRDFDTTSSGNILQQACNFGKLSCLKRR